MAAPVDPVERAQPQPAAEGVSCAFSLADDDFALFALPRRHAIDGALLDARWRALQSAVHPDRHVASDAAMQREAMQRSVRVNEAYRRLKDPVARAGYLCALAGSPIDAERNTAMPRDFLAQQMQWRETLDESADDRRSLEALEREVEGVEAERLAAAARALDLDADPAAAAAQVRALMFVRRFRQDLQDRLDAAA